MNWPKEHWNTIVEAFTARRVLVIGSIFSVALFVAKAVPMISWDGQPTLLGAPAWAWSVIAALLCSLWFALEYAHRKRMELVPIIKLSFDQNDNGIVSTPLTIQRNDVVEYSNAVYVRIKVEAVSNGAISGCVAFVTKIEKRDKVRDTFFPIKLLGPIILTPQPITIYSRVPHFVDFLMAEETSNALIPPPSFSWPLALSDAFVEHTDYRFTFEVAANNVTETIEVEVKWPGVWKAVSAAPVMKPA
jgi:hypothetical protein